MIPTSIREINNLPFSEKRATYQRLIPNWIYPRFNIDRKTLKRNGQDVVVMRSPAGSRSMELSVFQDLDDIDPILYFNMADTLHNRLMVLLVVINDPNAERFNIDVDEAGTSTHFGTQGRNIPEEARAKAAGLAPGQVRTGLRAFKSAVPVFEDFVRSMGHDIFFIEPLSYHNAIVFERYGFAYTYGRREMIEINHEFQPGGDLHRQLTDETPFLSPDAWMSIRGRSWAIHDGILGHPFTGFQMYKRVGSYAGVNTFPDGKW